MGQVFGVRFQPRINKETLSFLLDNSCDMIVFVEVLLNQMWKFDLMGEKSNE